MALTARYIENWRLVLNDAKLRTVKVVQNDVVSKVTRGWLEQFDHCTLIRRRQFYGYMAWTDTAGDTTNTFVFLVGGGVLHRITRFGYIGTSTEYVCTSDNVKIEDFVTGTGWEEQVWELQSQSMPVPGSYYEEVVT